LKVKKRLRTEGNLASGRQVRCWPFRFLTLNIAIRQAKDYHHTAADTLDKVVPRALAENAAAMAVLAYTLANLPQPLPR
jgi:hypothetical protein